MQNQDKPQLPAHEELRLKLIVRVVALLLLAALLFMPLLFRVDHPSGRDLLVSPIIASNIVIIGSVAMFLVFPAWYRYRHFKNTEEVQDTELFP